MVIPNNLPEGIYFLHSSFLEEASKGIVKDGITPSLQLLIDLVFQKGFIEIISCDRTMKAIAGNAKDFTPGIVTAINEKSHYDDSLEDDEYALKIASREKISFKPSFFIVAESKHGHFKVKAKQLGYKLNVLSAPLIKKIYNC